MKRLAVIAVLITTSLFLCGFSLFGGDISDAKKITILWGNKKIKIGSLIDDYKYFKNVKWTKENQGDGSAIIVATAEYDVILHLSDNKKANHINNSNENDKEFIEWIDSNLQSKQSIAPIHVKFYFSRYKNSASQRDDIAQIYADRPHQRDEILQKMKSNEIYLELFYEIVFNQHPYTEEKQSSPYKYRRQDLFSVKALEEMRQQKPISAINDGVYSIFWSYERYMKAEKEKIREEEFIRLKTEMLQALNNIPKQPTGSFIMCNNKGAKSTGSVYTLERIILDENTARAAMSVRHFSVLAGRINFQGSDMNSWCSLDNIQKGSSGSYSAEWKYGASKFVLRWNKDGYDLQKDSQSVELIELLNPEEAFMNMCGPKTEIQTFTGILAFDEHNSKLFYLFDPDSGSRLVEFNNSISKQDHSLSDRDLDNLLTIDLLVTKDTQEKLSLEKIIRESPEEMSKRLEDKYKDYGIEQLEGVIKNTKNKSEVVFIKNLINQHKAKIAKEYRIYMNKYKEYDKISLTEALQTTDSKIEKDAISHYLEKIDKENERYMKIYGNFTKEGLQNRLNACVKNIRNCTNQQEVDFLRSILEHLTLEAV